MTRVLLSAIEPFGTDPVNSSWEAVRLVAAGPPVAGLDIEVLALPCVFGESVAALRAAIARVEPDLVVATGQGGSRPDVTVELVAINLDDAVGPDNNGNQPIDLPIVPGGPAAYFSSLPVKECVAAIRAAGIPASISHTAGTYVCNHVAYGLAHLIATERPDLRGGFVHVPFTPAQTAKAEKSRPPSMASETAAEALRVVIRTAAAPDPTAPSRSRSWLSRRMRRAVLSS